MSAPLNEAPEFEIARFLKRLQWLVIAAAVFWLVWMLGPILTPFVLLLLGWRVAHFLKKNKLKPSKLAGI